MKILILGGTVFVGRHLVEAGLKRGHEITLFNRGQHNPDLFPQVEKLRGDRDGDLKALDGRHWDTVIDTNGYLPRLVKASAQKLTGSVGSYTFISSLSVYGDFSKVGLDEHDPVADKLDDPRTEEVTGESYGPLKVACERAAQEAMPGKVLIIRPGLIVGPFDPTDRFTYWPHRVAQGGKVLAPGRPERPVQFIDARDLAEWIIRMVEAKKTGIYNANGPEQVLTMGGLLETCKTVSKSTAHFEWLSDKFLVAVGLKPWTELPLWLPETDEAQAGFFAFNCKKAIAASLTFRPLAETVRDTLTWDATRPADIPRYASAGLKPEREAKLLQSFG